MNGHPRTKDPCVAPNAKHPIGIRRKGMWDETAILQRFIVSARMWEAYNNDLSRYPEPPNCRLSHYLPSHHRGYKYCHQDWQDFISIDKRRILRLWQECFTLGEVLELKELSGLWRPSDGLRELSQTGKNIELRPVTIGTLSHPSMCIGTICDFNQPNNSRPEKTP